MVGSSGEAGAGGPAGGPDGGGTDILLGCWVLPAFLLYGEEGRGSDR